MDSNKERSEDRYPYQDDHERRSWRDVEAQGDSRQDLHCRTFVPEARKPAIERKHKSVANLRRGGREAGSINEGFTSPELVTFHFAIPCKKTL